MNNEYRDNHYIPEFYLKNFTKSDNYFFVYDKYAKWNKILPPKSPSNICFERDRNIFFFENGGIYKDLERKIYGHFDNIYSETFKLLNNSKFDKFPWTLRTVGDLEYFVPLTYWRSPISDEDFLALLKKSNFLDEISLKMENSKGEVIKWEEDFKQKFLNDGNVRKALRPILAYFSFGRRNEIYDKLEWRIIYKPNSKVNLTSDNPIIFKRDPISFEDFRSSIIFPATRDKTLIRVNTETGFNYHHEPFLQDIMVFHQAKRYVICSDKNYLKSIAKEHGVFDKLGIIKKIKNWLFEKYE